MNKQTKWFGSSVRFMAGAGNQARISQTTDVSLGSVNLERWGGWRGVEVKDEVKRLGVKVAEDADEFESFCGKEFRLEFKGMN